MSRTHHPKKCQFCGKVFNPKHAETVFCSRKCHFEWRKEHDYPVEVNELICGKKNPKKKRGAK